MNTPDHPPRTPPSDPITTSSKASGGTAPTRAANSAGGAPNASPHRSLAGVAGIRRWTLERVHFLFSHLEDLVDDDHKDLRERARTFTPATGLGDVTELVSNAPTDPKLPKAILTKLSGFFYSGIMVQAGADEWRVTDLFWRGNTFHLEDEDQARADAIITEITPLQVHRAPAERALDPIGLSFLSPGPDAMAYLLRPIPALSYVLFSDLAPPFAVDHVANAHKLVNKCFLF